MGVPVSSETSLKMFCSEGGKGTPSATVIGVLADDDHFQAVERAFVEGAEDVAAARENAPRGVFLPYELRELREIGFFELRGEEFLPVGGYLYIHVTSG